MPKSDVKPTVICLMGPTASGKTRLACELYDRGGYELVSVDSALIYRSMDIGTAKPNREELARYPHHLIDQLDPSESYSAAQFVQDVQEVIAHIIARGHTPLLVGGTILYFYSLLVGLAHMPAADTAVRDHIDALAQEHGWDYVYAQLASYDPQSAATLRASDRQRVKRALEVYLVSGRTMSTHYAQQEPLIWPYAYHVMALAPPRDVVHNAIALRLEQMWAMGFYDEVVRLRARGDLHLDMPSMRCVGYRQVWQYLDACAHLSYPDQHILWQQTQQKVLFATRQLAKRQYTWINKMQKLLPFVRIVPTGTVDLIEKNVNLG